MAKPAKDRPVFRIDLRPEPDVEDATYALKRALKCLLRTFRLRCVRAVEVKAGEPTDAPKNAPERQL
jgi:hypothetical protein